mgnify:CR=1 FL=1
MKESAEAQTALTQSLGKVFALMENYPELKASKNVSDLQEELTTTENQIAFARQYYNDLVTQYNTKQQVFPSNMLAGLFGFKPSEFFEVAEAEKALPRVNLSLPASAGAAAGHTAGFGLRSASSAQSALQRRSGGRLYRVFLCIGAAVDFLHFDDFAPRRTGVAGGDHLCARRLPALTTLTAYYGGSDMILSSLGAEKLNLQIPEHRELHNIVTEMALASGSPMPRIFVILRSGAQRA